MVTIPDLKLTGQLYESDGVTPRVFSNWTVHSNGNDLYRSSGNVGIGTTSPGYKLEVNGSAKLGDTTVSYLKSHLSSGTGIWFDYADTMRFITNNTEKMIIKSDGNVGIGTTSPGAKLEVKGDSLNNGAIYIKSYTTTDKTFELRIRDDTTSSYPLHIGPINSFDGININNNNGNVGIGTASPKAKLDIMTGDFMDGFRCLITSETPVIVPPVPTPEIKQST